MIFFEIWLTVSLCIGAGIFIGIALNYPGWDIILIYPMIVNLLEVRDINIFGKIVMCTLITIIFAPAIVIYFIVLLAVFLITFTIFFFMELFEKLFRRKK